MTIIDDAPADVRRPTHVAAPARTTRIMLVDDDAMVRTGVRTILEQSDRLSVVAEASDGDEVVQSVFAHRPDVIFMDLHMKRMGGLDAIRALATVPAAPKVIALTSFDLDAYVFQALEVGAVGFLLKDSTADELIGAVDVVLAGNSILSPRSTAHLVRHFAHGTAQAERAEAFAACRLLTERERDVAVLVAAGLSNAEIGDRLFCSAATVKTHLTKAMAKLDAGSRVQVALVMQKAGLV
ncbi:response regulator [Spelaeicoccus albus]|nr:response regulator transcription factor [Spelaeicoccus albus]